MHQVRSRIPAVAAAASLAVGALAACGTQGSAQGSTDLAHAPSASFVKQARLVSARWARPGPTWS